jgi:hypothetical protein
LPWPWTHSRPAGQGAWRDPQAEQEGASPQRCPVHRPHIPNVSSMP